MARGVTLPPRGSMQSAVLEEMVHRERLRLWKAQEILVTEELWRVTSDSKTFEDLTNLRTSLMSMALHLQGAYDLKEKPKAEETAPVKKSDQDLLNLLNDLPDFDG